MYIMQFFFVWIFGCVFLRSQRTDEVHRGICPADLRKRAIATAPGMCFTHISVCSFLPLALHKDFDGQYFPEGVVVPFSKTLPAMSTCWPTAAIRANPSGSVTSDIFGEFVERCFLDPIRIVEPDCAREVLLIMDGGGGSYLHITPELAAVCLRRGCRIWLISPYGIKALCSLDQDLHKYWSQEWGRFKASWAMAHGSLNCLQALCACSSISEEALTPSRAISAYHAIGFDAGKPFNNEKILTERAQEVFGNLRSKATVPKPKSTKKRVFDLAQSIAPPKEKCDQCGKRIAVVHGFCTECGSSNKNFDQELY